MLLELKVKNLGIIEDITWRLRDGLNIITGETGAGKSLIIDAVELLLSGKADEEAIRYGANEAQIEAAFNLPQAESFRALRDLLAQKDLAGDEDTLIISCQLRRKGPSTVRVNSHAVPKALLHQIGRLLVDIHGQSEHLSLLDSRSHLLILDSYAHTLNLRNDFGIKVAELWKIEQELKSLEKDEQDLAKREEFLRFQLDEISRAALREGEHEELERERSVLTSTEKLKELSYEVYRALYEEDGSPGSAPALDRLNEAAHAMKMLVELDPALKQQMKYLEESVYGLTEVARDIRAYSERLHSDPARLEEIESRLELIKSMKRKYGQTIAEVLNYQLKIEGELDAICHHTERKAQLQETHTCLKQELGRIAHKLSQERSKAAGRLIKAVENELRDLNMAQVEFGVAINRKPDKDGIPLPDGESYAFADEGIDIVEFMASTNPGEPAKPLSKIASTGELSRFTLAIKGALSEVDNIPVLIFDEIDIGVGGRSGEIIGKKLWILSRSHQVVCVTHLPQITAFADAHYCVHKVAAGNRTLSVLEDLDEESRVKELAIMLSGPQYTKTSLNNAGELIKNAHAWKQGQRKGTR